MESEARLPRAKTLLLIVGGVALLVAVAFGRALHQGFSPIDDAFLIVRNLGVHGVTRENLRHIFTTFDPELYIPLTLFTFQLDYMLGSLNPTVFHFTNLFLHTLNALLVGWFLLLLTGQRTGALIAGLLFAVHPLHTEAVVWIAGRKDLLSTFFFLLSLIFYLRRETRASYAWSLCFFLCALLSKAMAVTLPLVLVLIDVLHRKQPLRWRVLADKLPFIALSVFFMFIATAGKERVIGSATVWETILMAGRSTVFYVEKLLVPFPLAAFYTHRGPVTLFDPRFALPWVFLIVVALIVVILAVRGTRPLIPSLSFGVLFFVSTLAPTFLNFRKGAETFVAVDRYAYLPSVGLLLLAIVAIAAGYEYFTVRRATMRSVGYCFVVIIGMLFTILSIRQTRLWDTPETLYRNALVVQPESLGARISLVKLLRERGELQVEFALLKEGLRYGDDSHMHLAAGMIYARTGQTAEAAAEFLKAEEMDPGNPDSSFSLGSLAEQLGNVLEAKHRYERAVELDPSYVIARVKLGRLYEKESRMANAESQFREALRWNPSSLEAHVHLSKLLLSQGKWEEARPHIEKARALDPRHPEVQELSDSL